MPEMAVLGARFVSFKVFDKAFSLSIGSFSTEVLGLSMISVDLSVLM